MRAIVCRSLGGPEVLEERSLPEPSPGPHDLLLEVLATGLNPVDLKTRETGLGFERSFPMVLGYDVCGVVRGRGEAVEGFGEGDRVVASPSLVRDGANAEFVCVDARAAARVADHVDPIELAALPLVVIAAWEALFDRCRLRDGEVLAVLGGAGGVGHVAIQLAREKGARVVTTAGTDASIALCAELGAEEVVDHRDPTSTRRLLEACGGGADVVLDTVGGDVFEQALDVVGVDGRIATLLPGESPRLAETLFVRNASLHYEFVGVPGITGRRPESQGRILREACGLVLADRLRPVIHATFPLGDLEAAHREQETGHVHGKVVIRVGA